MEISGPNWRKRCVKIGIFFNCGVGIKYIGAYAAAMGGVDVILFTGGVGENQATARAGVCKTLGFLGVEIDPERNKVRSKEAIISTDSSKVKVVVIPTDDELMIATDTMNILNNK